MTNSHKRSLLRCLFASLLLVPLVGGPVGCASEEPLDALLLAVTSEPVSENKTITSLRILATDGVNRFPAPGSDLPPGYAVTDGASLVTSPIYVGLEYGGTTFKNTTVQVSVIGLSNGEAVASWTGSVDLTKKMVVPALMVALVGDCDADKDGFADCTIAGCCAGGTELGDCRADEASANPWGVEPECEPCEDTLDQDCSGGDQACIDLDQDGVADCAEVAAQCGIGDPSKAPGLPELCDGIDNDCDGQVDEGLLTEDGKSVGEACGLPGSACEGGVVECDASDPAAAPKCDKEPQPEICGNGKDENCDGVPDNGCSALDLDGDGYEAGTGPDDDCNDFDAAFYPGESTPEPCCPNSLSAGEDELNPSEAVKQVCDNNCDGEVIFCDAGDNDGDGFASPSDCDDTDPSVYPGAPEKCDDGIDQDCFGGDSPCTLITDSDGDGYSDEQDCDDTSPAIYPGAKELCDGVDNDCDGIVDDGNPEGGGSCGTDTGICETGISVCGVIPDTDTAVLRCAGAVDPEPVEICDTIDHDCDGLPYNGLELNGSVVGGSCTGVGACGLGSVECAADGSLRCSTNPGGSSYELVAEVCDGLDNDCDGEVDEGLTLAQSDCLQEGVCGTYQDAIVANCVAGVWECNYGGVTGYEAGVETSCDGLDNDCDGAPDDDFNLGGGCDGDDADLCDNGSIACAPVGSPEPTVCIETGAAVEVCDGKDNDCDGEVDEDFTDLGDACDGNDADQCINGTRQCSLNFASTVCVEAGPSVVDLCNGVDDDCDGTVDEGFGVVGQACDGDDEDQCARGTFACNGTLDGVECVGDTAADTTEICDGIDNDCDGLIDEGANPNLGQPCDGDDADGCADGQWVCPLSGDLQALECSDDADTVVEICDGIDNDCNGTIDDGIVGDASDGNCKVAGICGAPGSAVTSVCTVGGTGTWTCDYSQVPGYVQNEKGGCSGIPDADCPQCNGEDDNCDGFVDEGFTNTDGDQFADCQDDDIDNDTILNDAGPTCEGSTPAAGCKDNCPLQVNQLQEDLDGDAVGDACDDDIDGDGVLNGDDNCPKKENPGQADSNLDGVGDACTVEICEAGTSRCDADGRTLQTCNAAGDAEIPSTCAYICEDGKCMLPTGTTAVSAIGGCGASAPALGSIAWTYGFLRANGMVLCVDQDNCTFVEATQESTDKSTPVVFCFSSMVVAESQTLYHSDTEPSPGPALFLVDGNVTINGALLLSGRTGDLTTGGIGGPGAWNGADRGPDLTDGPDGGGPGGGDGGEGNTPASGTYDAGGGGGGGFAGSGGAGGDAQDGDGGAGGGTYENNDISPFEGGSGGGAGGDGAGGEGAGPGGGGGGAVQIVTRGVLTISTTGVLYLRGGNGLTVTGRHGAGGGGAGGAALLEARSMSFIGDGYIDVAGGTGGDAKGSTGGAGAGAAGSINGSTAANTTNGNRGAGGGGGGAGRVLLKTPAGGQSCVAAYPNTTCNSASLASE